MPLAYYRTMYTGENIGVPVELIAYENRPVWTFENALACSLIHGFLPRPNDIAWPLELMSGIWDVFERFPIQQADWLPYWANADLLTVSDTRVRASFYRYTAPDGQRTYLLLCANVTRTDAPAVRFALAGGAASALELPGDRPCTLEDDAVVADMPAYTSRIFFLRQ